MTWLVLILSGVLEAVWAIALSKSENFSRALPSLVFLVTLALSMAGLAYALRELPGSRRGETMTQSSRSPNQLRGLAPPARREAGARRPPGHASIRVTPARPSPGAARR